MDIENKVADKTTELSGRKRKKLYLKLRTQMEFYFSDSNLAKDKFLFNLIHQDKDGYVDLEIFKSFNKIKALSEDISFLAASLTKSSILELNENKSRVRRKTPIQISKDFDACTLYVEGLPPYADFKWIKDVFDHFGTVEYINIPRFNISQKIKGFAFIEFSDPESVKKACQFYKSSSDAKNDSSEKDSPSLKETKGEKSEDEESSEQMEMNNPQDKSDQRLETCSATPSETSNTDELKPTAMLPNKRKLEVDDNEGKVSCKKQKLHKETGDIHNSGVKTVQATDERIKKTADSRSKSQDNNNSETADEESCKKSKKKRMHSKKNRNRHERPTLRVMSKSEWKTYRNKYLDLQRTTMSYLKKQILLECQEVREQENNVKHEPVLKKELKFHPGVIIKIKLSKSIENPTEIKEQIKACAIVAYIDAPMGNNEVYIRCHAAEDASSLLQDKKFHNIGEANLLSGTDEEEYWKKIQSDRETKLNTPVTRKRRGRDKLIAKAAKLVEQRNKHIYFDE